MRSPAMRPLPVTGIAGRVFLYTGAIVCAVLLAALGVALYSGRRAARDTERRGVEQAADLTAQLLAGRERSLAGGARVFVQGPYFRALVAARRRDDILDQALEAADQLGADWVFITDDRGVLLAKSDEPSVQGIAMGGIPLVTGALEGRTMSGYGASRDTLLFQAVAVPIVVPGVAPVGVLVATKIVDARTARDVRAATGADVAFYTLDEHGAPHLAASSFAARANAAALVRAAGAAVGPALGPAPTRDRGGAREGRIAGAPYVLQGTAVTTSGGEIVGGFVVARPQEAMARQLAGVRQSLVVAGVLGLLLALLASWSAARRVTRPTRALAAAASRAVDGEYDAAARAALEATVHAPRDEIAALAAALAALLEELREKQALVTVLRRTILPAPVLPPGTADRAWSAPAPLAASAAAAGRRRAAPALVPRPLHAGMAMRGIAAFAPGSVIADRYALRRIIGAGGTGIVYEATDLVLEETVALKALRPDLLAGDAAAIEELKQEVRLTRRVSHRNVVRTYDFGIGDGVPFLTMELVDGASLARVLAERGALPDDVTLVLAKQLARALAAAHGQGIVHGDVKPGNLLVTLDGQLKVTDFGVASLVRRPRGLAADESASPPQVAGAVVGTPEYMAPELLLGGAPEPRTDLYAMGMVLHECMTGATPFPRDTPRGFLARKLEPPRRSAAASRAAEPATLAALAATLAAPDPESRPASAAAVLALLSRIG